MKLTPGKVAAGLLVMALAFEFNQISNGEMTASTLDAHAKCSAPQNNCSTSEMKQALDYSNSAAGVALLLMGSATACALGAARRKTAPTRT